MNSSLSDKIKSIPRYLWIILCIIILGIFLRTYNFHDWLRFNADQGRDADVVSAVLSGKEPLPLLGPKAGGTEFRLGPAFYYFEIISAKIFGNYPDKMAYPDLATSILCIPLIFLFLRKYFDKNTALSMSAIFAVSSYAIRYSRFAWNPNSIPFWTILALYAIHEVISQKSNKNFLWSTVAGIAIGIGVQLHTTLLFFLPITAIIVFGYLAIKNIQVLKYFLVILAMSLFLNVPQMVHEYQYHGENMRAFFGGAEKKQGEASFAEKIIRSASCWVQGNADIISGYEISDTCSFKPEKNKDDLVVFVFGALFIIGGTLLGLWYLKKETDPSRKSFLMLVFVYTAVAYIIFVPIAFELSVRFYLALIFLPFLLMGFWWKFIMEKIKYQPIILPVLLSALLICSNIYFVEKYFAVFMSYDKTGGTVDVTTLKEAEEFAQFIILSSKEMPQSYIDGNAKFLFKAYKPIRYFTDRAGVGLILADRREALPERYFYVARAKKKETLLTDGTVDIIQQKTYGKFTILLLQKKQKMQ